MLIIYASHTSACVFYGCCAWVNVHGSLCLHVCVDMYASGHLRVDMCESGRVCDHKYVVHLLHTDSNHLVTASLIFTAGRDRSGIGANQSVRAESTLASKKPSIRFVLLIWLMARSNIADFLVAGCRLALSCRSSSAASRIWREKEQL